jgi:hypothetical protein
MAQAGSQGGEGGEVMAQAGVDPDPTAGSLVEGDLEGSEESNAARDRLSHEAELAEYLLPALPGYSLEACQFGEDGGQGELAMRR